MAFDNPPWVMDATTVDGEVIRRALGTLINPAGGIVNGGDLQVTQNGTPNMTVNIGIGQIWVPGSTVATQGPYYSRNAGSISQAINAANATNPRIDTVGVQVQDAAYAGALKQLAPFYVPGTATAGANLTNLTGKGAVPASSYVLAFVQARAGATSIITSDILNVASVAGSQLTPLIPIVVSTSVTALDGQAIISRTSGAATVTLPAPAQGGLVAVMNNTSTGITTVTTPSGVINGQGVAAASMTLGGVNSYAILVSEGSNWLVVAGQQDTGWVAMSMPTNWSVTSGCYAPAARLIGDRVWLRGSAVNGTGANASFTTTLATQFRPVSTVNIACQSNNMNVSAVYVQIPATGFLTTLGPTPNIDFIGFDGVSYSLV